MWKESRDIIAHYARKIDDFDKFSQTDQDILLEASWVEILCLYTAFHLANRYALSKNIATVDQKIDFISKEQTFVKKEPKFNILNWI